MHISTTDETLKAAEQQAEICKVFSNPKRILILWALAENDLAVGEIAVAVGATVQNTSHHLRLMKDRGILYANRIGQSVSYGIASTESTEPLLKKAPAHREASKKQYPLDRVLKETT